MIGIQGRGLQKLGTNSDRLKFPYWYTTPHSSSRRAGKSIRLCEEGFWGNWGARAPAKSQAPPGILVGGGGRMTVRAVNLLEDAHFMDPHLNLRQRGASHSLDLEKYQDLPSLL